MRGTFAVVTSMPGRDPAYRPTRLAKSPIGGAVGGEGAAAGYSDRALTRWPQQ
jgi:hypothetical protein